MIIAKTFAGKKIAIVGLGISGILTAKSLLQGGAEVIAWDDNEKSRLKAQKADIPIANLEKYDWSDIDYLVLSPGIALHYPKPHWSVEKARARNIAIIGDIEIFIREWQNFLAENKLEQWKCPLITITGTNGKSTTTALLSHLLTEIGCNVQMGGNIGVPILSLDDFSVGNYYVIEISSYQIDLSPSLCSSVAMVMNISPDHLDRHGNFENYLEVKKRLLKNAQVSLLNIDDEHSKNMQAELTDFKPYVYSVNINNKNSDYYLKDGNFNYSDKLLTAVGNLDNLRGKHNAQNLAMALAAVACLFNNKLPDMQPAIASFKALPHRLEKVAQVNNIIFINDSKATNAEATIHAIKAFNNIHWIVGGVAKDGGIKELLSLLNNVKRAYLIGESSEDFAKSLDGICEYSLCGDMQTAVTTAYNNARQEQTEKEIVILLSPACASFDQFSNYEERGKFFIELVQKLVKP